MSSRVSNGTSQNHHAEGGHYTQANGTSQRSQHETYSNQLYQPNEPSRPYQQPPPHTVGNAPESRAVRSTQQHTGEATAQGGRERAESNRGSTSGVSEERMDDARRERQQSQHVFQQGTVKDEDAVKSKDGDSTAAGGGASSQAGHSQPPAMSPPATSSAMPSAVQPPAMPPATPPSASAVAVDIEEYPNSIHRHSGTSQVSDEEMEFQDEQTMKFTLGVGEEEMIGDHPSYHQGIPGEEAIRRLRESGKPHCYLTRYSEQQGSYVLTVYKKQTPKDVEKNFEIVINNSRPRINGIAQDFANIGQLLEHYERCRIHHTLKNIGEIYKEDDYEAAQRQQEAAQQQQEAAQQQQEAAQQQQEAAQQQQEAAQQQQEAAQQQQEAAPAPPKSKCIIL